MTVYRNGTYIAFHAGGTSNPTESDMKYYELLKAWKVRDDNDFEMVNSHDKTAAVRDSSKKETLRASLVTRLLRSKNMILIIGNDTKQDDDWVPFEIQYAVDKCQIPIIAAYPNYNVVLNPLALRNLWPAALAQRISRRSARVIHVPFRQLPLAAAVSRFDVNNLPRSGVEYYSADTYRSWGLL